MLRFARWWESKELNPRNVAVRRRLPMIAAGEDCGAGGAYWIEMLFQHISVCSGRRVVYYSVIFFCCVLFLGLCSAALCVYSLSCGCRVPSAGSASAAMLNSRRGIAELYIRRLGRRQLKQDQHHIFFTVCPSFLLFRLSDRQCFYQVPLLSSKYILLNGVRTYRAGGA